MPILKVTSGGLLRAYPIGERVTLGRLEECDITIENLGASRKQAEIVKHKDAYVLRDLGSKNGTYVDGARVEKVALRHRSRIEVADWRALWLEDDAPSDASSVDDVMATATRTIVRDLPGIAGSEVISHGIKLVDDMRADEDGSYPLTKMLEDIRVIDLTHVLNEKAHFHPFLIFDKPWLRISLFGWDFSIPPAGVRFEKIGHASIRLWGFTEHVICTGEHTGTHIDAPLHFLDQKRSIDEFLPDEFVGPAVVIDIEKKIPEKGDYLLSTEDIAEWVDQHGEIPKRSIVLMYSNWSQFWGDRKKFIRKGKSGRLHIPCFSEEAAELLVNEYDVLGVGTECVSIDSGPADFPAHQVVLGKDKFVIENLDGLHELPPKGAHLIVAPLKIEEGSGGPGRVLGLTPNKLAT